jgi:hypothetical protein
MRKSTLCALVVSAIFAAPAGAQDGEPAGRILWSFGQVERVAPDGAATALAKGDPVFEGDVIRSGAGSHAQLIMADEALLAVRAGSSVKLAQYRYAGQEDGSERAVIELLKGGLRSVTGAIGRTNKDHYQLKNETAVIGIRGTDHETFATPDGTYNRVTMGGTYLAAAGGRVELAPGDTGFAGRGMAPLRLARTPDFMHAAALRAGNTGPKLRAFGPDDERRLHKSITPVAATPTAGNVLPAQSLGEGRAWGRGGRCEGACADFDKNKNKSK